MVTISMVTISMVTISMVTISMQKLASFPDPAQLSIASSTVKREMAWYLFSCE